MDTYVIQKLSIQCLSKKSSHSVIVFTNAPTHYFVNKKLYELCINI